MNNECPICQGDYYNISKCYWVCKKHLKWIVTICEECKKPCFSDCCGICPNCFGYSSFTGDIEENADNFTKESSY